MQWGQTGSALALALVGVFSAWLTFVVVRRRELKLQQDQRLDEMQRALDHRLAELEQALRNDLRLDQARRARDRSAGVQELLDAVAGPLLVAVWDLSWRLRNILDDQGHVQLAPEFDQTKDPRWTSTHQYFMSSSVYVFGSYFAWAKSLRQRLGADAKLIRGEPLIAAVAAAESALSTWPASWSAQCRGRDSQVFTWQQRALGQAFLVGSAEASIMTIADHISQDPSLARHAAPLVQLLVDLPAGDSDCRRQRLRSFQQALHTVESECTALLDRSAIAMGDSS